MTSREIGALTGLRGVAASWVVIYHMHQADGLTGFLGQWVRHGYLAVDIFFVLSGFVMGLSYADMFRQSNSIRNYLVFLVRRLARVWPLYAILTCVYAAILICGLGSGRIIPSALAYLLPLNLIMVQAWGLGETIDHPAWSISTEFAAYLLFPFLAWVTLFARTAVSFACGVTCVVVLVIVATFGQPAGVGNGPLDLLSFATPWPVLRCLSEFCIGLLAYRIMPVPMARTILADRRVHWLLPALMLVMLCLPATDIVVVLLVPPFLLQTAMTETAITRLLASRPVYFLGLISYAIYLLHWMLLPGRRMGHLLQLWFTPTVSDGVTLCLLYVMLLAGATLNYYLIEMPGRRMVRRFGQWLEHTQAPPVVLAAPTP